MAAQRWAAFYMAKDFIMRGNDRENNTFRDVHGHYMLAKQDLDMRIMRKNGFNDADKMFSSYVDEASWPFNSVMVDPRAYTVILEKAARLIGSKPKGRLVPREGGDTLGAYVNNELLSYQWDDNTRLGESMISKWIMMDMNTRKYGAAFGVTKWRYETKVIKDKDGGKRQVFYDGPDFVVCNPRDVLMNPSYSYINKWFQHREYVTIGELEHTNDAARGEPVYKNLDVLREAVKTEIKSKGGDRRDTNYTVMNKSIRQLTDWTGSDEVYKTIEIITEYRDDRWITFSPRYGVVIRDIDNPNNHRQIPVVQLKYYPLPDDGYGVSELEPSAKLLRGINALFSQYIDNISLALYPPLMINPTAVRMHTLDFAPRAKWLMNNPQQDIKWLEVSTAATTNFQSAYQIMVGSLMNSWGEGSQGTSQINPTQDEGRVTAAEIKDTAFTRNVRDNMNQIFLSEALKKQIMFWHAMNQQFLFQGTKTKQKVIRIVGRDAVEFFNRNGLADIQPTEQDVLQAMQTGEEPPMMVGPRFPIETEAGDVVPKFEPDVSGEGGNLHIEEGDLLGTYDYIPDIESMKAPSQADVEGKLTAILGTITNPAVLGMLQQEGKRPKIQELLIKLYESTNVVKDAEAYFEDAPQPMMQNAGQTQPTGGAGAPPGQPDQGNAGQPGMAGSVPPVAPIQNQPLMA